MLQTPAPCMDAGLECAFHRLTGPGGLRNNPDVTVAQEETVLDRRKTRAPRKALKNSLALERLEERLLLGGGTFYVDDDYTSGTPGWGIDHFDRIRDAISVAGADDTILVAAGVYRENINLGSGRDGLVLQGAGAETTIVDGKGSDSVFDLNDFDRGVISGFTIRNGSASEGGGVNFDSSNSTLTGCIITGNEADMNGGGVYVDGGSPTIVNNVLYNNAAFFGGAFYMDGASPTFANNTIYGNTAVSCGGALYGTDSQFTMNNCILWANKSSPLFPNDEIMLRSDANLKIRHSIVMDGDDEIYAWLGGDFSYNSTNMEKSPKFVAPASANFRLQSNSPAIDAANGDKAPASDFDGNPRVDDPLTANKGIGTPDYADIGAFEFVDVIQNEPPTVESLSAEPDTVTRPEELALTASGVDDPDGAGTVAAVEFYRDTNANGTFEAGTDVLIGTDTNGTDGWSWTGPTAGWPTGHPHTYFARARDNYSIYSEAVSATSIVLNAPPEIESLMPWLAGGEVTLTARNVSDDDTVSKAEFYLDDNGDGIWQDGVDTYLGDGSRHGADWAFAQDVSGWAEGSYTLFARVQDNDGVWSDVVSGETFIGQRMVGLIADPASEASVGVYANEDVHLDNIVAKFSGGAVKSLKLGGTDGMYGLGLVIHSDPAAATEVSVKDGRKGPKRDVFFVASDAPIKSLMLKSAIVGHDLNGQTFAGMPFAADVDGDGDTDDLTAIVSPGAIGRIMVKDDVQGDVLAGAADSKGIAVKILNVKGGYQGDFIANGDVKNVSFRGDVVSRMEVDGCLSKVAVKGGSLGGTLHVADSLKKIAIKGGSLSADVAVDGVNPKNGLSLVALSVSGDFSGSLTAAGGANKLRVNGDFAAGADVTLNGLLKNARIGGHDTDNAGQGFGFHLGSLGKLQVASTGLRLYDTDLPHESGDFCVERV